MEQWNPRALLSLTIYTQRLPGSRENGLRLVEIGEGVSLDDVRAATGASFQVSADLKTMGLTSIMFR
ncbi:hypothetical protein GBAR_LOCUS4105 [Geodia barretti]|uniref:Uncharacterized protein n=1 Tax=Geodia barretti TaxID=519541 RepID=A0AA35R5M4_GEOBA|nr:hypothetical protein GBAR_LOCUS4105 [Geodia barretti]